MNRPRIPARTQRAVRERDAGLCAYCLSPEALMGVTFEVDHILPYHTGGQTALHNLCLSYPTRNRCKGARMDALDPATGETANLFHPVRDLWADHFQWSEDQSEVVGLTPSGRATVEALRINRSQIIAIRRYWVAVGRHPALSR